MGAARDSSDDFGVELSWPEDELAGSLRPGRVAPGPIDARSKPQRADQVRRRPLELPSEVPRDMGRAVEMLSDRIDGLVDAVGGLQDALADRLEDHRAQLISLRRRVARLDSMDDLAAELVRKRDEVFQALGDRSARQDKLQQQLVGLSKDVQALRRRMSVGAKDHLSVFTESQIEAVVQAVLAALRQESVGNSGTKRRSPGRTSRK